MTTPIGTAPAPQRIEQLETIADRAVDTARRWLRIAASTQEKDASAERLAAVLDDRDGVDFTVGFVDRVIRTEDAHAAGAALTDLARRTPAGLPAADRAQIRAGAALAPVVPQVVVPAARARMRQMLGHMIVDARPGPFGRAVRTLRADGSKLNVNLLGEAVLGEAEAAHHTDEVQRLLERDDVDYVSIKVSSIASQIDLWAFEESSHMVRERLRPLLRAAAAQPAGSAFVNLDMEEYHDLELTLDVFTRLLDEPELLHYEAGIVIQAYLPDALAAVQRLSAYASQRAARGGAGIKIRLVKGANLPMESVHAEVAGWPLTVWPQKADTDANYKRVLDWVLQDQHLDGLRLGVASHNVFDIAFAHELANARGVHDRTEFEMLQGMARAEAAAIGADVGDIRLYVPAVHPAHFDAAVSYLVRRLDENSSPENFMSGITRLRNGNDVFRREESRFREAVTRLTTALAADGDTPPTPFRQQDRAAEAAAAPAPDAPAAEAPVAAGEAAPALVVPAPDASSDLDALTFHNEPDTDPALPANRTWWEGHRSAAPRRGPEPIALPDTAAVDAVVTRARAASTQWAAIGADARARILLRAADLMAARRGDFLATMAHEVGKTPDQADPEVSEAIDFLRYYALRARELDRIPDAAFAPDRVVVITPPWNFPVAIPTGSTVAALAVGAAAIHKPSSPTPRCSALIVECLHDAGVPADVLQLVRPTEGDTGRALVAHPDVDRVILTGASETAVLFRSFRADLPIAAETSGKNALVITPSADRDLAVADLVRSAFGHAGQKCSAASLGILVGSVATSRRFRDQLVDAAASLVVGWPGEGPDGAAPTHCHEAGMGPLTIAPEDKLLHALTQLEPGEEWLLEPRRLDGTGRLWSPGIKTGVAPGSPFHRTEVFGPVLGLMRADSLDEAIALQNAVDFGLTAGIHSLDAAEVAHWLDTVEAGNVYVNRGITGAIVQRQPFGGWKKSSVGLGSKAGGPHYLQQFGTWHDAADAPADPDAWLAAARASDARAWAESFRPSDPTGLDSEANILRVLPRPVTVRVTEPVAPQVLDRLAHAASTAGAPLTWSLSPAAQATAVQAAAGSPVARDAAAGDVAPRGAVAGNPVAEAVVESADAFAARVAVGELDDTVGARIRVVGPVEDALRPAVIERPEVAILDGPVTASGEVELRHYVHEQAVSMTLHRFGTPDRAFHDLADRVREGAPLRD